MGGEDVLVVAIDGVSRAGKTTVAWAVARRLGAECLESGSLYRAVTYTVLRRGIDPRDQSKVEALARQIDISIDEGSLYADGTKLDRELRSPDVDRTVGIVAEYEVVRTTITALIREWARNHDVIVVEGRDIATNVFPDAAVKVFLTADIETRARRALAADPSLDLEAEKTRIEDRDRRDKTRKINPVKKAKDAELIETQEKSPEDIVGEIIRLLPSKRG